MVYLADRAKIKYSARGGKCEDKDRPECMVFEVYDEATSETK